MSGPDERRIAELAKKPPQVLRDGASAKALEEARRVLEVQALICHDHEGPGASPRGDGRG